MSKMIDLTGISADARSVLVKAIPHQRGGFRSDDAEYFELYQQFMKETDGKYLGEGSFNKFQCAVEGMRRRLKTLSYKGDIEAELIKGRV